MTMKARFCSTAVIFISCTAIAAVDEAKISVPLPAVDISIAATTLYCSAVIYSHVDGQYPEASDNGKKLQGRADALLLNTSKTPFLRTRLRFGASTLSVASAAGKGGFDDGSQFRVVNESPEAYVAIRDRSSDEGIVEVLVINRVKGMAVLTYTKSSGNDFGPSAFESVYACSPTE